MISTDIQALLMERLPQWIEKAKARFISESWNGINGRTNKPELVVSFTDFIAEKLIHSIATFVPPSTMDLKYDPFKNFWSQFVKFQWHYLFKEWLRLYKASLEFRYHEIPASDMPDNKDGKPFDFDGIIDSYQLSLEHATERQVMLEHLQSINTFFCKVLRHEEEAIIFNCMLNGDSDASELIAKTGLKLGSMEMSEIRAAVTVRYVILLYLKRMRPEDDLLMVVNRYPDLCKLWFGRCKLTSVPEVTLLKSVLFGDFRQVVIHYDRSDYQYVLAPSTERLKIKVRQFDGGAVAIKAFGGDPRLPLYKSKKDRNGRKHQRYVTFVNGYGRAYDHTCDESWQLPY